MALPGRNRQDRAHACRALAPVRPYDHHTTAATTLPHETELADIAHLAGAGIHHPHERPFLTPWTDGSYEDRARAVLRGHWSGLAAWQVTAWQLGLGVFHAGEPIGMVNL